MGVKILIVKLSSLGDVVHTLPVVQDILSERPDAQIDWVVEKAFASVLTPLLGAGLQRVIACELRRWRKSPFSAATRAAWRTGPLIAKADANAPPRQLSVFAEPTPSVQAVWDAWLSCQPKLPSVSEWQPLS